MFLQISQNSLENTCARVSFLIKLHAGLSVATLLKRSQGCNCIKKEILTQVFSCRFCEISKSTFFYRTPPGDCFYPSLVGKYLFKVINNFNEVTSLDVIVIRGRLRAVTASRMELFVTIFKGF